MDDSFVIEAFTLLGLAITIIGLRIIARWIMFGLKNLWLDDYLMLLAGMVYALEVGAAYMVGARFRGLANNSMTDEQRVSLSPHSEEYRLRVGGSKIQVTGWSLYTLLLWLLKTCMAISYSRLMAALVLMRIRIYIAYVLIVTTYIATICSILFGCHPIRKNWQIYPNPGNQCQPAVSKIIIYVTVVLNVVTDIYLISIPTLMLFTIRLHWWVKLKLIILFSGGLFVMTAGVLRCVLILTAGAAGAQRAGAWAIRETFVAIVIGNAPMIYPLFRNRTRYASVFLNPWNRSHNYPANQLSSGDTTNQG